MDIREDLKAFLDGELSPERAAEVQIEIDREPALREEYEFMKLLSGEIKSAVKEPQIKGLEKAMDQARRPRLSVSSWRWAAYAGSGLAGLFLIGLIGNSLFPLFAQSRSMAKNEITRAGSDEFRSKAAGKIVTTSPDGGGNADATAATPAPMGGGGTPSNGFVDGERTKSSAIYELKSDKKSTLGQAPPQSNGPPTVHEADRLVVRTADLAMKVKDVRQAVTETVTQVTAMGGIIANTQFNEQDDGSRATMSFTIPERNFNAVLDTIHKAGKLVRENLTGNDVTDQVAGTDGRIHALADEEGNLIQELARTRDSSVRLEIRTRLSSVRQEMESLKYQNEVNKKLAAMSQVTLEFQSSNQLDEAKPGDWFGQTTAGAGDLLGYFGRFIGVGVIYMVFLSPVWAPIAVFVWWMRKRAARLKG